MSATERDGYRRTLFDKHGPEAADLARTMYSLVIPVLGAGIHALAARRKKGVDAGTKSRHDGVLSGYQR